MIACAVCSQVKSRSRLYTYELSRMLTKVPTLLWSGVSEVVHGTVRLVEGTQP